MKAPWEERVGGKRGVGERAKTTQAGWEFLGGSETGAWGGEEKAGEDPLRK